nr:nicotinamide riboside kinase [Quercus suber]
MPEDNALILGISGPSSSGKTTLARLLRDIFPNVFLIHEDDFYKTDTEIPKHPGTDLADWDCLESIDVVGFERTLRFIRETGSVPSDFVSKEDKNSVGKVDVDRSLIEDLRWKASRWMFQDVPPIAIVDGFLLFSEDMQRIRENFDVKIFLRTDYATAKQRREARSGYVTLEGFWEDPPGYVDKVVWPNYVKDHQFLFEGGNVEGVVDENVTTKLGIKAAPREIQNDISKCLEWAYEIVSDALHERVARAKS